MKPLGESFKTTSDQAGSLVVDLDAKVNLLAEIALACGFADQSHFTRVFSRIVGVGPAAWRRAQGSMWKYVPPREVSASEAKSSRSGCSPRAIPWNSQREIEARV